MTLSPTERKIVVGLELEKANIIFSQIEVLQNAGFWDNIANRLYYSLFHAVSALLINEGLPVNSHKEPYYYLDNISLKLRFLISNTVSYIRNCRLCVKGVTIIVIMMYQKKIFFL